MSTNPSASRVQLNPPRFDGFPYLTTRVVAGLYHVIVIPARQQAEWYQELLYCQGEANQLETCLVLDARTAWFWSLDGGVTQTDQPPTGGVIVTDRLQPCEAFDRTPDLSARHTRLTRFSEARKVGGYLHGDLNKGGRTATREECHRLAGVDADGVPNGLEQCGFCGDRHGKCLDPSPNFTTWLVQVHCRCENHNRCARCGLALAERRLNANYYRESDGHIWHTPGFCGLSHLCPGVGQGTLAPEPDRSDSEPGSLERIEQEHHVKPVLVYTVVEEGFLVFTTRQRGIEVSQMYAALEAKTWGEFRALMPTDAYAEHIAPCVEEDSEQPADNEPFEPSGLPGYDDGDFPPWLATEMDTVLPAAVFYEYAVGESSVLNGPFWTINLARLSEVVRRLEELGYEVKDAKSAGDLYFR